MAYISQEKKKSAEAVIKPICDQYGVKGRLSIRHHSALVFTAHSSTKLFQQFDGKEIDINLYRFQDSEKYTEIEKEFIAKIYCVMRAGNHNNSDIMTDYHDVGWYMDFRIGKFDKPFVFVDGQV